MGYWTGNFWMDYIFFFMNWHPLCGLFLAHPDHPLSMRERVFILIINGLQTVAGAFVFEARMQLPEYPPNEPPSDNSTEALAYACSANFKSGRKMSKKKYQRCLDEGATAYHNCVNFDGLFHRCSLENSFLLFITVTFPVMLQMMVLKRVAMSETKIPTKSGLKQKAAQMYYDSVQRCFFSMASVFTVVLLVGALQLALESGENLGQIQDLFRFQELAWTYMDSKVQSFLLWFPIYFLTPFKRGFLSRWSADRKRFQSEHRTRSMSTPSVPHQTDGLEMQVLMTVNGS